MLLKEHSQKPSWPSKRAQRCLSFAVIFMYAAPLAFNMPNSNQYLSLIVIVGLTTHNSWPRKSDLTISTVPYGSSPEAGRPTLPFVDNSVRRSTEDPFFETDYEDEYDDDDDADDDEAQQIIQPRELTGSEILTREELVAREGNIIGLR